MSCQVVERQIAACGSSQLTPNRADEGKPMCSRTFNPAPAPGFSREQDLEQEQEKEEPRNGLDLLASGAARCHDCRLNHVRHRRIRRESGSRTNIVRWLALA